MLPLVGVVTVVEHVAELLQLSQGLRHRPTLFPLYLYFIPFLSYRRLAPPPQRYPLRRDCRPEKPRTLHAGAVPCCRL